MLLLQRIPIRLFGSQLYRTRHAHGPVESTRVPGTGVNRQLAAATQVLCELIPGSVPVL